jgi:hypothetical protein
MIAFPSTIDASAAATATPATPAATGALAVSAGTAIEIKAPTLPTFPDDTERLGDEIARLAAHLHAATYHLLVLIREFDEREGWGCGFLSCGHWLSWRTGIGPGPAREKVRVARALASLPLISGAMAQGQLSYSKVRAITRVASPENERDLLEVAKHSTAAHIEKLVKTWRWVDRIQDAEDEQRRHESRFLRLYPDSDGMYVLRGRLDPEVGALLEKVLEWASDALFRNATGDSEGVPALGDSEGADAAPETAGAAAETKVTLEQRRADAVGLLADRAMAVNSSRAGRFQVVLHSEAPSLKKDADDCQAVFIEGGVGVSAETSRRLVCDASVVHMTHDAEGNVLDVGRKRRTVPPSIRRALEHRDKGCRFPGCGRRYTDAHHITHWADGGETKLDNLTLVCSRHHRAVHEEGFRVEITEGGTVEFFRPDGKRIPSVPEGPPAPEQPVSELMQAHEARGITPEAWTPTPLWHGEAFDYGLAIDMLRSR